MMGQFVSLWDDSHNNNNNTDNTITHSSSSNNNNSCKPSMNPQRQRYARHRHYNHRIQREVTENGLQKVTRECLDLIHTWFPHLNERTYFLPPVHMNTVTYRKRRVGGVSVQEVLPTAESDWRDDEVMQRVLHCLRRLTDVRQEPMVVLLQMQHDNYLNKPCYAAAAAKFPRPLDLPTNLRRGDFDLLFLHRDHGIIVAEIKSVGWRPGERQDDAIVVKKVHQALEQLKKAETVLTHLVSDLRPNPGVRKTLVLPNVTSCRLQALIQSNPQLQEAFLNCFNASDVSTAVSLCLCAEQMTTVDNPSHVTEAILKALEGWWLRLVESGAITNSCTREVYELMVARFCGPASTVQVYCVSTPRLELRTLGEAVSDTGDRMVQFALFPQQLALLESGEKQVYLTGPPGTGKTLILILLAVKWVRQGHVVHIVSSGSYSEAATQLIYHQVTKTLQESEREAADRVRLHLNGNCRDVQPVIGSLLSAARQVDQGAQPSGQPEEKGGQLHVIADEVDAMFKDIFLALDNNVRDLHVWAATYHHQHRPAGMAEKRLTACLRAPPTVQRRMQQAVSFANNAIYQYEDVSSEYLAPTDGPPELYLSHEGHPEPWAMDCVQCGQAIADCLIKQLHVGSKAARRKPPALKTPQRLQYRDVMVIPDWYQDRGRDFHDDVIDKATGEVTSPASGLVRGLRSEGVPVKVVTSDDSESIRDLARASENCVWVVGWGVTNGLERKVVVSVGEGRRLEDGRVSGVLHGASRCTAQLVYVQCPEQPTR